MLGESVSKPRGQSFLAKLFSSKSDEGYYEISGLAEGETINLHRGANSYSPVYTSLKEGDLVYRFDAKVDSSGWSRVEFEEVSAWVETKYLRRAG